MGKALNNFLLSKYVGLKMRKGKLQAKMNKKGVNNTLEVVGMIVMIVGILILIIPQARSAVSSIWTNVMDNTKSFFNDTTQF